MSTQNQRFRLTTQLELADATHLAKHRSLHTFLKALPQSWQTVVQQTLRPEPLWLRAQGLPAAATPLLQQAGTAQVYSVSSNRQLASVAAIFPSTSAAVEVVSWDPARPLQGPSHSQTTAGCQLC